MRTELKIILTTERNSKITSEHDVIKNCSLMKKQIVLRVESTTRLIELSMTEPQAEEIIAALCSSLSDIKLGDIEA